MEKIGIPYLIGGSLASSIYGIPRATQDADIVADIHKKDIEPLNEALKDKFYIDTESIKKAIKHQSYFNLIHLKSMFKIDVYIFKREEFYKEEFKRRQKIAITSTPERKAYIATPEDTILSKLEWFRKGEEVSDRQWDDILGILKVQKEHLDMNYLYDWASKLNLTDLLKKSLREVEK